jgi:hypothetical protein
MRSVGECPIGKQIGISDVVGWHASGPRCLIPRGNALRVSRELTRLGQFELHAPHDTSMITFKALVLAAWLNVS